MHPSPLRFPPAEIAEARRVNRRLGWMPRFRARMPWDRLFVQTMVYATQRVLPLGVRDIRIETRVVRQDGLTLRLRVLRPAGGARGVYVDFHGGGWAVGNARMDDPVNARIASECGITVVSVDYDLVPRRTLPQVIEQCAAAAAWVFDNCEAAFGAGEIVMGGESAGAHLAACAALRLRGRGDFGRLKGLVLFYGAFDLAGTQSALSAAADTLVLHGPTIRQGLLKLTPDLTDAERRAPGLSPLHADLSGLPPALLLVGTRDPLLDDSTLLADHWQAAGSDADLVVVPEAPHAFNRLETAMARRTNAYVRGWIAGRLDAGARGRAVA